METKVVELKINTNLDQTNSDVTKLQSNLKGAESGAKDFDKAIGGKKSGSFKELGGAISDIIPGFGAASQGAGVLNKALLTLVANPIGLVIAGVALVLGSLYAIFKDFQPLVDKVEQSFAALGAVVNVLKNTFIAVFTGTKSLGEAFSGLGGEMNTAAKRTMELTKAQQDLDDAMEAQTIKSAMVRAEINKLNVMMKDRTKTEEERLAIAKKSEKAQEDLFNKEKDLANKQTNILGNKLAQKYKFSREEKKLLFTDFEAAKALAESRGAADEELFDKFKDARLGQITIQEQATTNLEKNQNKQEALLQAKADKEAKAASDAITRNDKAEAERAKKTEKQIADDAKENERLRASGERSREQYEASEKIIADAKKANDDAGKSENQLKVDAENLAFENKKAKLIEANLSIEEIEKQHKNNLNNLELDYRTKEADASIKATADAKAEADKKKSIEQATFDLKINLWNQTASALGGLSNLFKKGTAAAKGAALAEVAIGTATGLINGLDIAQKSAKGTGPAAAFAFPLFYATQVAAVFGAVGKAKAILGAGGGGGGSAPSIDGGRAVSAIPNFNVVGTSGQNQIAQTLNKEQSPIRTYVVYDDVKTAAAHDRNIVQSASVG